MSNKLKRISQLIREKKITRFLFRIRNSGYLYDIGWFYAYSQRIPVDQHQEPIPWVTYSFIQFITPRLTSGLSLFEFGSGNSTLFYAKRVKSVTALEHDKEWHAKISSRLPANATVLFEELEYDGSYCRAAVQTGRQYDIIIVDGRDRVNCMRRSLDSLSPAGVLVLDDSEREEYTPGKEAMQQAGFRSIDFWGISPGEFYNKATTVFYRPANCLNI